MEVPASLSVGVTRILKETDWSEPWLVALVFFHFVCIFVTYITFHRYYLQIGYFLSIILLVFSAEYINEVAAENWRFPGESERFLEKMSIWRNYGWSLYIGYIAAFFSKHQYFDSRGLFISLVFSTPLLLNAIIIVIAWVFKTLNVMIELKTVQQKRKARREKKKSE